MRLMINIPDEAYELLKSKSALDNIAESIIANGTPISNEGDLISRKALKEDINSLYEYDTTYNEEFDAGVQSIINFIDNASTVPQTIITEFKGCDNCELERPHGEWIKWDFKTFGAMGDWEYKCSNCEKVYGGEYNFCPNCGADMRKGST